MITAVYFYGLGDWPKVIYYPDSTSPDQSKKGIFIEAPLSVKNRSLEPIYHQFSVNIASFHPLLMNYWISRQTHDFTQWVNRKTSDMNKVFPEKTLFYGSTRYFYLKQAGKTIPNVQFYEMDHGK